MRSRWDDGEAAACAGPLGPRVHSSRLLGREPSLVLHGGGNTSVKAVETNLFGEPEPVLYLKGSGRDLRKSSRNPDAPQPSVEALLHASIPATYVDHSHADAVLAITNS